MKKKKRKSFIKIIKNIMAGFDMDELMSIKNGYQGNKFQWVKSQDKKKLGTIVTVSDIIPGRKMNTVNGPVQRYRAALSDGSTIDTEQLSSSLMMLMDDQQAMSMAEIQSINADPGIDPNLIKANLPPELQELSTIEKDVKPKDTAAPVLQQPNDLNNPNLTLVTSPQQPSAIRPTADVDTNGLFGMFSVEDTTVTLKLAVKLPAKNLLKMMYTNSQNKEDFLTKLSAYINNSITQNDITDSVKVMMGHNKKSNINERKPEPTESVGTQQNK